MGAIKNTELSELDFLIKMQNDISTADCGEGISFNLHFITKDIKNRINLIKNSAHKEERIKQQSPQ